MCTAITEFLYAQLPQIIRSSNASLKRRKDSCTPPYVGKLQSHRRVQHVCMHTCSLKNKSFTCSQSTTIKYLLFIQYSSHVKCIYFSMTAEFYSVRLMPSRLSMNYKQTRKMYCTIQGSLNDTSLPQFMSYTTDHYGVRRILFSTKTIK